MTWPNELRDFAGMRKHKLITEDYNWEIEEHVEW